MNVRRAIFITIGLIVLIGAFVFLTQAVEPPRETAVEVLEYEQLAH